MRRHDRQSSLLLVRTTKNFPADPKQQNQECKPAQPAEGACLRESLGVIIMAMIYDEAIVNGFVTGKHFLKSAQAGSGDGMIEKNLPGSVQHFNPAPLTDFQSFITGEALQCTANPQPRDQDRRQALR